jgi:GTP cyclohydrolase II
MTDGGVITGRPLSRLASAPVPVAGSIMQLTVFGTRADDGEELEEIVSLRTLAAAAPGGPLPTASGGLPPLVRLHSACFTGDVLGSEKCDCGQQLAGALTAIQDCGNGSLLYLLRQEGRGIGLANKIRAYALQSAGHDTISANLALGLPVEDRDFRSAAECLRMMGLHRVRLLTNSPMKIEALTRYGIQVSDRVPLSGFQTPQNRAYLATKDRFMGHLDALGMAWPGPATMSATG